MPRTTVASSSVSEYCVLGVSRSEEHTSELQSQSNLVCRLLLEKKKTNTHTYSASPHRYQYSTSYASPKPDHSSRLSVSTPTAVASVLFSLLLVRLALAVTAPLV